MQTSTQRKATLTLQDVNDAFIAYYEQQYNRK